MWNFMAMLWQTSFPWTFPSPCLALLKPSILGSQQPTHWEGKMKWQDIFQKHSPEPELGIIISLLHVWEHREASNLSKITQLWRRNQRFVHKQFGSRAHTQEPLVVKSISFDLWLIKMWLKANYSTPVGLSFLFSELRTNHPAALRRFWETVDEELSTSGT